MIYEKRSVAGTKIADKSIVTFESVKEAARYLSLDPSHITKCCRGKRPNHGGYTWSYCLESEDTIWIPENSHFLGNPGIDFLPNNPSKEDVAGN